MKKCHMAESGPAPGGIGIWHRPRELQSTKRYAHFVQKLRREEESSRYAQDRLDKYRNIDRSNHFLEANELKCYFSTVKRKTKQAVCDYDYTIDEKRQRLKQLLEADEMENIADCVREAQKMNKTIQEEKWKRLEYLKQKNEERIKTLSQKSAKCPCLRDRNFDMFHRDSKMVQTYQIMEKQMIAARKKQEDLIWLDVMKHEQEIGRMHEEAEARRRAEKQKDCDDYNQFILDLKRKRKEHEEELIKNNASEDQKLVQAALDQEAEELRTLREKKEYQAKLLRDDLKDKTERLAKEKARMDDINGAYDHVRETQINKDADDADCKRRRAYDNRHANDRLIELKETEKRVVNNEDAMIKEIADADIRKIEERRCRYKRWANDLKDSSVEFNKNKFLARDANKERARKVIEDGVSLRLMDLDRLKLEKELKEKRIHDVMKITKCELLGQAQVKLKEQEKTKEEENAKNMCFEDIRDDMKKYGHNHVHAFTRVLHKNIKGNCLCAL